MLLAIVLHATAVARRMWQVPAEVDLSRNEPASPDNVHLAIAEAFARRCARFVDNERALSVLGAMHEVEAVYQHTVGPAARQVGGAIERIIDRARETIIIREQLFDRGPVLVDESGKGCAGDGERVAAHDCLVGSLVRRGVIEAGLISF